MTPSQIPADFTTVFGAPGSTVQISNMTSPMVDPEDQFIYEGAVRTIAIEDEELVVEFDWLAQKHNDGVWRFVTDTSLLHLRHSLALFRQGMSPDRGRFIFMPLEPISHDQVLCVAHDYLGPTGRQPLKREEVQPAA